MDKVHFSTGKDDWGTPQDLFDALNKEFNFTLDPCADDNNHKCAKYYTEDCLSVNENIQGISDFSVSMENDVLTVSFVVNTIYGDIEFKDQQIAKPTAA